jgi:hypothetical protein
MLNIESHACSLQTPAGVGSNRILKLDLNLLLFKNDHET